MKYEIGAEIGGYRLIKNCGSGAYGTVFVAENILTGKRFAIKIISMLGGSWERELNALICGKDCQHRNLLPIHHIAQTDDAIYYVMDLADNLEADGNSYLPKTLANRIQREGRIPARELTGMINQLLDGLEVLHKNQLLHRDIKPDNILWISGRVVLGDIGLVSAQQSASFAGTLGFLPDEVARGRRPPAFSDDLYALGKVVYCASTGNSPDDYPDYPADLPIAGNTGLIAASIAACQAPYLRTAQEFRDAMATLPTPILETPRQRYAKWLRISCAAVAIGLLLLAGTVFVLYTRGDRQKETVSASEVAAESIPVGEVQNSGLRGGTGLEHDTSFTGEFRNAVSSLHSEFTRRKEKMLN